MSPTEQRRMALEIANASRMNGAQVLREVRSGILTVGDAFEDPRAQGVPIGRLLTAQRRWGPTKADRLLKEHHIWPMRRVRDLTARQRRVLREALEQ